MEWVVVDGKEILTDIVTYWNCCERQIGREEGGILRLVEIWRWIYRYSIEIFGLDARLPVIELGDDKKGINGCVGSEPERGRWGNTWVVIS